MITILAIVKFLIGVLPEGQPSNMVKPNRLRNGMQMKNKMRRLILFLIILLQITCLSSLHAMDLMQAYKMAKEHDPLFGSYFYEHEAAKTLPKQGRSFLLPKIQASSSVSRYDYDSAPYYYQDFNSEATSLSVQQPLFNLPKFHEYRQHAIRGTIGDVKFIAAEQDLMLRVCEAYFKVLAAGNLLELIDAEKKAIIEQREQARRMFKAGIATITDVHDAEARFDSVVAKRIEVKNELDIKMQALKKLVGIEPDGLNSLKEDLLLGIPGSHNFEDWIEKAKQHHPILKSYAYQIDYQEAELSKFKGQYWPSVDLVGGYIKTNTNNSIETDEVSYGSVGVQVNLPIFNGGYTTAKVEESHAFLGQARKDYENALAEITQKLSEAFLGIRGNVAKIDALLAANKTASTSLNSNKKSLMAGVRTTIDVLNAERDLQDVRTRLLQARYDCLMNIVRLKAFAGTLSGDDLLEINAWLQ